MALVRKHGHITNRQYQALAGITDRAALRDFEELTAKGALEKRRTTGRSIHYVLRRQTRQEPDKGDAGASDRETRHKPDKGDTR